MTTSEAVYQMTSLMVARVMTGCRVVVVKTRFQVVLARTFLKAVPVLTGCLVVLETMSTR